MTLKVFRIVYFKIKISFFKSSIRRLILLIETLFIAKFSFNSNQRFHCLKKLTYITTSIVKVKK